MKNLVAYSLSKEAFWSPPISQKRYAECRWYFILPALGFGILLPTRLRTTKSMQKVPEMFSPRPRRQVSNDLFTVPHQKYTVPLDMSLFQRHIRQDPKQSMVLVSLLAKPMQEPSTKPMG